MPAQVWLKEQTQAHQVVKGALSMADRKAALGIGPAREGNRGRRVGTVNSRLDLLGQPLLPTLCIRHDARIGDGVKRRE